MDFITMAYDTFTKERGRGRGRWRRRDSNEGGTMSGGEEQCDAIKEWLCFFSSGKTKVIGQGTAPVLVPMTSVFFGFFSHTLKIKATLDNTLIDIMPSLVLL